MSPGIYAIIVPGVNRYGEENLVKIFQIGQKFGGNAIEVNKEMKLVKIAEMWIEIGCYEVVYDVQYSIRCNSIAKAVETL